MSATVLYTPEVLALATQLARWPWPEQAALSTEVRSPTCGSSLALALKLDREGRVTGVGLKPRACAIGQAAAAIFAEGAPGHDADGLASAHAAIAEWLAGKGPLPEWPGLATIAAAADYPARHGAVLLPWKAATALLPTGKTPG